MFEELLELEKDQIKNSKVGEEESSWFKPNFQYSRIRRDAFAQATNQVLATVKEISEQPKNSTGLCELVNELLVLGHENIVPELKTLGWDFVEFTRHGPAGASAACSATHMLADKGYSHILERVGAGVTQYDDIAWAKSMETERNYNVGEVKPILPGACARALPNLPVVKVLVEKLGVDINAQLRSHSYRPRGGYQDQVNASSLHILAAASHWWQFEALEFLLERGANTEVRNEIGETPLHVALTCMNETRKDNDRFVEALLKHGADPNAADQDGKTCLYYATTTPRLISLLVERGANVNGGSKPPLIEAIENQNLDVVQCLLAAGADVNLPYAQEPPDNPTWASRNASKFSKIRISPS
ncbi:ankyrin, partial [Mytilinidion resinicola]